MIFYLDSVANYKDCSWENLLTTLENGFNKYKKQGGYKLEESERKSWEENYLAMKSVLDNCTKTKTVINDCQILVEYNIPEIPKRIDYVLLGKHKNKTRMILCELKQGDEVWYVSKRKAESVYINLYGGDQLHPAAQVKDYEKELGLSKICKDVNIKKCCYLYNLPENTRNPKIKNEAFNVLLEGCEIFFKNEEKNFSQGIGKCFDDGISKAEVKRILK